MYRWRFEQFARFRKIKKVIHKKNSVAYEFKKKKQIKMSG